MTPTCPPDATQSLISPLLQGNPKFLEAVATWQKRLGAVDLVLNAWGDVQRKWQALESIFVGSADIRVQLPEDSKRFDAVNADFVVRGWAGQGSPCLAPCTRLCLTLCARCSPVPCRT